jgi:hypothetical protein
MRLAHAVAAAACRSTGAFVRRPAEASVPAPFAHVRITTGAQVHRLVRLLQDLDDHTQSKVSACSWLGSGGALV